MKRFRTGKRNERGAALVEAAVIFLPLSLIVFGMIEFGFVFKDSLTLSNATRSGARAASAQPKVVPATFIPYVQQATASAAAAVTFSDGDTMWIFEADANGNPKSQCGPTSSRYCMAYTYQSGSWGSPSGAWDTNNDVSACLGTATPGAGIDSVGVQLQFKHDAITGFFHDLPLREKTVMKFEPTAPSC